jgi:hypothetical protein
MLEAPMKRLAFISAILVLGGTIGLAQDHSGHNHAQPARADAPGDTERFEGYVLDKHCATGDGEKLSDAAKSHARACLVKRLCARSGYGLVVDGKWYAFDARGSAQAARLIRTANFAEHEKWEVRGWKKDDVIRVSRLEVAFALR